MDPNYKFPASPGTPLFQVSPERVNQQRYDLNSPSATVLNGSGKQSRDSSVHERAAKFDTLAFQGKVLERKANDAALKRAMVGREEAETEMRRYREEARLLRKQVEDGKDRERKVGERLENVMESYGRAKETHAHTQILWEKEIRRARKESFKSQSVVVKLQEELKAARNALKMAQADLEQEKGRIMKREQEAFNARYQLVGVQEELSCMTEKVKLVEQERDALRTIAKNEEIARIAAEGHIPLPALSKDDEFATPSRATVRLAAVTSSLASEEELENLKRELEWERQRADRALDHSEFIQVECQFRHCSCRIAERAGQGFVATTTKSRSPQKLTGTCLEDEDLYNASPVKQKYNDSSSFDEKSDLQPPKMVFIPAEGVFKSVLPTSEESPWISPAKAAASRQAVPPYNPTSSSDQPPVQNSHHARTPSCEPPATAIVPEINTSLLSLIEGSSASFSNESEPVKEAAPILHASHESVRISHQQEDYSTISQDCEDSPQVSVHAFHTISTTTRIPLANPPDLTPPTLPAHVDGALSPTMTREEALAQIRERRGRARSLAQGTLTPRKQMVENGTMRRDISAPAVRSISRGRIQGRN